MLARRGGARAQRANPNPNPNPNPTLTLTLTLTPTLTLTLTLTLTRRQHGSQHGCVLIEDCVDDSAAGPVLPYPAGADAPRPRRRRLLGQGWNHAYIGRDRGKRTSRHVHAEAHAIADAIRRRGEPPTSAHGLGPSA